MGQPLPVIVGFGGVNPAGRVSFHHAFRRTVIDALDSASADDTYASLRTLMNVEGDAADGDVRSYIRDNTLVRRIDCFDPDAVYWQRSVGLRPASGDALSFALRERDAPDATPEGWRTRKREDGSVEVTTERASVLVPDRRVSRVSSGGQLPKGFEPGKLYSSRSHPRGLQLTIYAASDAVQSVGLPWEAFKAHVRPDEFACYSGSAMGQLDGYSAGGMMQAPMMGKRPTSKQAALGLCEMPADFINAYVIGGLGGTGGAIGACATFLYNLKIAVDDIRAGRCRVAIVGGAEAPIVPGDRRGVSHHGRTGGRRSADGHRRRRNGGQPPRLPPLRPELRLHAGRGGRLRGARRRCVGVGAGLRHPRRGRRRVRERGRLQAVDSRARSRQLHHRRQGVGPWPRHRRRRGRAAALLRSRARHRHAAESGDGIAHPQRNGQDLRHRTVAGGRGEGVPRPHPGASLRRPDRVRAGHLALRPDPPASPPSTNPPRTSTATTCASSPRTPKWTPRPSTWPSSTPRASAATTPAACC